MTRRKVDQIYFWITGKNWTEIYLVNFSDSGENLVEKPSSQFSPLFAASGVTIVFIFLTVQLFRKKDDPETPNFKDSPL